VDICPRACVICPWPCQPKASEDVKLLSRAGSTLRLLLTFHHFVYGDDRVRHDDSPSHRLSEDPSLYAGELVSQYADTGVLVYGSDYRQRRMTQTSHSFGD